MMKISGTGSFKQLFPRLKQQASSFNHGRPRRDDPAGR
jgi:hypothetical protein